MSDENYFDKLGRPRYHWQPGAFRKPEKHTHSWMVQFTYDNGDVHWRCIYCIQTWITKN